MEISQILPYLNNGTKVYVFDSPKFLKKYLEKYPDGQATLEIKINNVEELIFKDKYKPILRPLSDVNTEFCKRFNISFTHRFWMDLDFNKYSEKEGCSDYFTLKDSITLLKYHFDLFNLIKKGIAIDVNEFDVAVY